MAEYKLAQVEQDLVNYMIDEKEHEIMELIRKYAKARNNTERLDIREEISNQFIELRNIAYMWGIKKTKEGW